MPLSKSKIFTFEGFCLSPFLGWNPMKSCQLSQFIYIYKSSIPLKAKNILTIHSVCFNLQKDY